MFSKIKAFIKKVREKVSAGILALILSIAAIVGVALPSDEPDIITGTEQSVTNRMANVQVTTGDVQFLTDGAWVGTGTDAAWAFSSAADQIETTAREVSLQSPTDTTTTPALDVDKTYQISAGTVYGVDVTVAHDPQADQSGYAGRYDVSTVSGNANEPPVLSGIRGSATVANNSEAGYAYGVYGTVTSYGEDAGGLSNVVEAVNGSATALDVINGHIYGMDAIATCYGSGYGFACDATTARGIKAVVDNTGNGQIDDADGGYFTILNRDTSSISTANGVFANLSINQGTMGTFRGVYVGTPTNSGTLTNNYGLYIDDQWVGTNKYSIYVDGSAPISMLSGQASTGQYGTAIGRRARVNHTGSLVLADSTNADFISATTDRFHAQFVNGYYLYTNAASTTGMFMAAGGSAWNAVSDRGAKEDFATVDGNELLDRIAAMPTIETWQYKDQEGDILHVGAMADEFNSLVDGLGGEGEDRINQGDAIGVNLAAIQALTHKVDALEKGQAVTQSQAYQMLLTQPHIVVSASVLLGCAMVSLAVMRRRGNDK